MQGNPPCCAAGASCGERAREGTVQLPCSSLAPLSNELSCETGSFPHCGNPCCSPQSALSLSFAFSQPYLPGLPPHFGFSQLPGPCGLVVRVDFFFNSVVVGVPCTLIFWHFLLFIDFRLVVIFLLVVQGREGFLPTPPSWPEL